MAHEMQIRVVVLAFELQLIMDMQKRKLSSPQSCLPTPQSNALTLHVMPKRICFVD